MSYGASLEEILAEKESDLNDGSRVFCADALSTSKAKKKINKAYGSYAGDADPTPILLVDITLMGGAGDGLYVTETGLYAKPFLEDSYSIPLSKIERVRVDTDDKKLIVNRDEISYTHSELNRQMKIIAECLNEYIRQRDA